jgi:hypothetical protein
MKFGNPPVNLQAQFFGNATYPRFGSPWSMRLQAGAPLSEVAQGGGEETLRGEAKAARTAIVPKVSERDAH